MKPPQNILLISLTGIGNTLLFTPALRYLGERNPQAVVDVLVEGRPSREIIETNPAVHKVINLGAAETGLCSLNLVRRLRSSGYDRSYTGFPSNRPRFNVFTWTVGARERIIHSYPDCSFPALTSLQTRTVAAVKGIHDILQHLRLVAEPGEEGEMCRQAVPRPMLYLKDSDRRFGRQEMSRLRRSGPVVAMHPGSSAGRFHMQSAKRYPAERFAGAAQMIAEGLDATVLLICGPDEEELKVHFKRRSRNLSRGRIRFPTGSIREIAALVEGSDLLISNDSGLMHIALALRTPVVALFGPTNVERTGPVWEDCRVLTGKNYKPYECFPYPFESTWSGISSRDRACWEGLTPRNVFDGARQMLVHLGVA
jgi:heptosyltransferase-2